MPTLLAINASARSTRSISRDLSRRFISEWQASRPDDHVIYRDVGTAPPSFVSEDWIAACFTAEEERSKQQNVTLEESDTLIAELKAADVIVLATPMYNYGLPAALKAWIDMVIRIGKTFSFDLSRGDYPLEPILLDKTLVCLTSKGEFGFAPGGIRASSNHLDSHMRTIEHYLGVQESHYIAVEYQEFGDARHDASRREAEIATTSTAQHLIAGFNSAA